MVESAKDGRLELALDRGEQSFLRCQEDRSEGNVEQVAGNSYGGELMILSECCAGYRPGIRKGNGLPFRALLLSHPEELRLLGARESLG